MKGKEKIPIVDWNVKYLNRLGITHNSQIFLLCDITLSNLLNSFCLTFMISQTLLTKDLYKLIDRQDETLKLSQGGLL